MKLFYAFPKHFKRIFIFINILCLVLWIDDIKITMQEHYILGSVFLDESHFYLPNYPLLFFVKTLIMVLFYWAFTPILYAYANKNKLKTVLFFLITWFSLALFLTFMSSDIKEHLYGKEEVKKVRKPKIERAW